MVYFKSIDVRIGTQFWPLLVNILDQLFVHLFVFEERVVILRPHYLLIKDSLTVLDPSDGQLTGIKLRK